LSIFGSTSVLSLDFGSDRIKGVVGKYSKKGIHVEKSFMLNLPEGLYQDGEIIDIDQLTYLLRNVLSENNIGQLETYGVINSTSIILREVSLPTVLKEEIDSIISYQLDEYIPINPEDYVVKYISLGQIEKDGIPYSQILLIGMPRAMIQAHLTLLKSSNLKPTVLDYHGNAIAKLITEGGCINQGYPDASTVACVDLGYNFTQLSIVEDGKVKVARALDFGSKDILDELKIKLPFMGEPEIMDKIKSTDDISIKPSLDNPNISFIEMLRDSLFVLMDKIEMIVRYYNTREQDNKIDLILLYGNLSHIIGLDTMFNDFFEIETAKLLSLNKVKINNELSQFANATGALVRLKEVKK
jgi:type IV pilus assembly protein PilM